MPSPNLDSRELPKSWPGDIRRSTEMARGIRANPLLKTLIEGLLIEKCCSGSTVGFTEHVASEYIRRHLGDEGLDKYRGSIRNGASEAEHILNLRDSYGWKVSPLTVALTLTNDLQQLYSPAPHMRLISDAIVDAANGKGELNVGIAMPARYGKSQQTGRYGTGWFLANYPGWPAIAVCATDDLALDTGHKVKNDLKLHEQRFGFALAADSAASGKFNTSVEGGMFIASGIFGQIAGRGAAYMTIDDVFKGDVRMVANPLFRDQIWDMWLSVLQTRLQAGAICCNVGTRYHSEDLLGRWLSGKDEVAPLKMRYICLPALATAPDELGRDVGDPLPLGPVAVDGFGYTKDAIEQRKLTTSEEVWMATYQQVPLDEAKIGLAYSHYSESKHSEECWFDETNPIVYLGVDFNVSNMSWMYLQSQEIIDDPLRRILTNERNHRITVFNETQMSNTTTYASAQTVTRVLHEFFHGLQVKVIIAGDASGANRSRGGTTQVPESDWSAVGKAFNESGLRYSIRRFSTNGSVKARVDRTQGVLRTPGALVISPKCRALRKDLSAVRWKRDNFGNVLPDLDKRDADRSHMSDALDYALRVIVGDGGRYGEMPYALPGTY